MIYLISKYIKYILQQWQNTPLGKKTFSLCYKLSELNTKYWDIKQHTVHYVMTMLCCMSCRGTNLLHWFHFRYVKLQHVLNSTLQCNYRTWTTGAWTLQLQFNNAVFKAPVQNITSILLHCWPGDNTASERQSNRDTTHLHILTLFECPEALLSLQPLHHHHLKGLKNEKIFIFINKKHLSNFN